MEQLIRIPWPPSKSSPNGSQGDWRGKAEAGKRYKATCAAVCIDKHIRPMTAPVVVRVTFYPPTARRYDLDNAMARIKRGLDAVSEAIGVDDADWQSMHLHRGEKVKGGEVIVHVTQAKPDLSRIATLSDPELRGWWRAVMILETREEEPGEREMLHSRARALGVDLSQVK